MYTLLRASVYDFIDDKTGKPIKGGKVCLMSKTHTDSETAVGYEVDFKSVSKEIIDDLFRQLGNDPKLPCDVDVSLEASLSKVPKITGILVKTKNA